MNRLAGLFLMTVITVVWSGCSSSIPKTLFNGGFGAAKEQLEPGQLYLLPEASPVINGKRIDFRKATVWMGFAAQARPYTEEEKKQLQRLGNIMQKYLPLVKHLDSYGRYFALDNREVNAFAKSDAIVVNKGLLDAFDSDDQVAVLLGHEIGHLINGDVAIFTARNVLISTGEVVDFAANALNCTLGTICTNGGNVGSLLVKPFGLKFSRDQEREADRVGFDLLCKAGFDVTAATEVWSKMQTLAPQGNSWNVFVSTHPSNIERLNTLSARVSDCPAVNNKTPKERVVIEPQKPQVKTMSEQLQQLKQAHDMGLITKKEYQIKRQKILERF